MDKKINHLPRYFCKHDDRHKVMRGGGFLYISDNKEYPDTEDDVWARSWEYYKDYRSIILLGPPRQGKTQEFLYQSSLLEYGFSLPLRDLEPYDPESAFEPETLDRWKKWLQTDYPGELFIDALDEGKLEAKKVIKSLVKWLNGLGNSVLTRLRVHLSCREVDWKDIDQGTWQNLFTQIFTNPKDAVHNYTVLALLDLGKAEVCKYCELKGVDPSRFLSEIPEQASTYLQRPHTLRMLVDDYLSTGLFPKDLRDLYDRVIDIWLQEYNEYRREIGPSNIPLTKKHAISKYYAVTTQMAGREIIAVDVVDRYKHIPAGGSGESLDDEKAVFSTALFEPYAEGLFRFADPGLTDYLASLRLNELFKSGSIACDRLSDLFFPYQEADEIIPRLRNLAGWLCAVNPNFRHSIIKRNPTVILHDYVGNLSDDDKIAIWRWIVTRYADRLWFDDTQLSPYVSQLACAAITGDLRLVLSDKEKYGRDLRILAIKIAQHGKIRDLANELVSILEDRNEKFMIWRDAAYALADIAPEQLPVLKRWLDLPKEQDPDKDFLGTALDLLWPDHIDLDTMIAHLYPQYSRHHVGRYYSFLFGLSKKLSSDERAKLLDTFANEFEKALLRQKSDHKERHKWESYFYPASEFGRFLFDQLEESRYESDKYHQLERWLSIYDEAATYMFVSGLNKKQIHEFLSREHALRQKICAIHIKRLSAQEPRDLKSVYMGMHGNHLFLPHKEDLSYWQQILIDSAEDDEALLESAWAYFKSSWAQADYLPTTLDWLEEQSERFPSIARLWEGEKSVPYDPESDMYKWRIEDAARTKQEEQEWQQWISHIREGLAKLRTGDMRMLIDLENNHRYKDHNKPIEIWIEDEIGNPAKLAFIEGLHSYWASSNPPDIESIYPTNSIPWWSILVLLAVDKLREYQEGDWTKISPDMRHKALIAGLWDLNKLPDWYQTVTNLEPSYVEELFSRILKIEANSENPYPKLARNILYSDANPIFRRVAYQYIVKNPELRIQVALPLLEYVMKDGLREGEIELVWQQALDKFNNGHIQDALRFIAILWRFRPNDVWQWLNLNYLGNGEDRKDRFDAWIGAIENVYLGHSYAWPDWVDEKSLVAILPYFFNAYPPSTDPSMEAYNSGNHIIQRRSDLGRLRGNALQRLAESGSEIAGNALTGLLESPTMKPYRDILLYYRDIWRRANTELCWTPLSADDLWPVLTKGIRPVRTHAELFDLVCAILDDIQKEIETGEIPVKDYLWIEVDKIWKPRKENILQTLLADKIKNHPVIRNQQIVSGRELAVGGNFPDIFITCILPNGNLAKVYIEIKQQLHAKLLTAINDQLANKYLSDPEARYGIYLVGWYGEDQYSASKTKLSATCSKVPTSAKELEHCLQSACDEVTSSYSERIDGIRAMVIDATRKF